MQKLVERARRGEGPAFLECLTYRYYGHHVGDINRTYYRSKEEEQGWRDNHDPLKLLADKLLSSKLTDQEMLERIYAEVKSEVETGVQFAIDASYPDPSQVTEDVYA
jgi:pyruvate dehydrogenase E1 component alpha subunit